MATMIYTPEDFADDLRRVVRASRQSGSVRATLVTTRDRDQALTMVRQVACDEGAGLHHFAVTQRRRYRPAEGIWEIVDTGAADPPALLRHARDVADGVIVFDDCLRLLRDDGGDAEMRMTLMQLLSCETRRQGLVLVFLAAPEAECMLPSILGDQFVRLDVGYPRAPELEAIAREEIAAAAFRRRQPMALERIRLEAGRLASGVVGMTRSAARDALRDAMTDDAFDLDQAFERLQQRKAMQLKRELAMNVLDGSDVDEPVGLDYLMEHILMSRERMRVAGAERARGILLVGPAGTGKTMLARAIGKLVELPVVEFRIAALMNSLLGETERRFSQGFATLEAMSPNVVFIDEIEKAFGDSSERDGGTMMRCTGSLLSWLSDNPNPNFIVATSNSLRRMGEIGLTMTRSERFDACFFVDVPNRSAREQMLRRWLEGRMEKSGQAAADLASVTDRFSGADLRSIVKQASARAQFTGKPIGVDLLVAEAERKRTRALGLYEEFAPLRAWGRLHCDPAGPGDED